LLEALAGGRVVTLSASAWSALAPNFPEVLRRTTGIAGDLIVVRLPDAFAAVEAPDPDTRTLRRLANEADVQAFVGRRLEEYERMWDGCGCRIDYFA